jgi:GLPGLI family protein
MKSKIFSALTLAFSLVCVAGIAQTKLTILYKHGTIKSGLSEYLKPNNQIKWTGKYNIDELTISDSLVFLDPLETYDEKDEFTLKAVLRGRKNKVRGKNFVENASYCNYSSGVCLQQIIWKDDNYLVKDKIENQQKQWILSEEKRTIFGYPCKQAFIQNGENIEKVVWYTENFKCSYTADGDTSVPGTILETFIPKHNTLITAIDLQIETGAIVTPKAGTLITRQDFDKKRGNKRG